MDEEEGDGWECVECGLRRRAPFGRSGRCEGCEWGDGGEEEGEGEEEPSRECMGCGGLSVGVRCLSCGAPCEALDGSDHMGLDGQWHEGGRGECGLCEAEERERRQEAAAFLAGLEREGLGPGGSESAGAVVEAGPHRPPNPDAQSSGLAATAVSGSVQGVGVAGAVEGSAGVEGVGGIAARVRRERR